MRQMYMGWLSLGLEKVNCKKRLRVGHGHRGSSKGPPGSHAVSRYNPFASAVMDQPEHRAILCPMVYVCMQENTRMPLLLFKS